MKLALALLTLGLLTARVGSGDAIETEWELRRWALGLDPQPDLAEALRSADWRVHEGALTALARSSAPLSNEHVEACVRSLKHEHPSVQAAALTALAHAGATVSMKAERLEAFAGARLPEVRSAFALLLGRSGGAGARLVPLAHDVDERVRETARAALFGEIGDEYALDALEVLFRDADLDELLPALEWTRRLRVTSPAEFEPLRLPEELSPGRRALAAAVHLARGSGTESELDQLLSGWFAPELEQRAPARFVADTASILDESLAPALVELWLDVDRGESIRWPTAIEDRRSLGEAATARAEELLRIAMDALGASAVVNQAGRAELTVAGQLSLLEFAAARLTAWDREVAERFLATGDPDVRRASLIALGRGVTAGDPVSAELVAGALESESELERRLAFESLCDGPDPTRWMERMFRAWQRGDMRTRRLMLRELPRGSAHAPFRDALLELGEAGGSSRDEVLDLLVGFRGDEEIAERLESWLETELAAALSGELGGPSAAERRAAGALRSLDQVAGRLRPEELDALALDVLRRTAEYSEHIGEVAVECLSRADDPAAYLAEFLEEPTLPRTRTLVAIALARTGHERATDLLYELLYEAPWELAFRVLFALGQVDNAMTRLWLTEAALDATLSPALRRSAADDLGREGASAEVREHLLRIALHGLDVETMTTAMRGLGRLGLHGRPALRQLYGVLESGDNSRLAELEDDLGELARMELLLALAKTKGLPSALFPEVLARPLDASAAWLDYRLRGEETARVEFVWREELQLFELLAERYFVSKLLGRFGAWWRLESRLLILLGELAEEVHPKAFEPEAAGLLLRSGLIGLLGELREDPEYALRGRLGLLRVAVRAEDWVAAQFHAERLVQDWRENRLPARVWNSALGTRDRQSENDPPARLAALGLQLRARRASAELQGARARELVGLAARVQGFSLRAREAQASLEETLGLRPSAQKED